MPRTNKAGAESGKDLSFEEAARLLKALGHPLRLRLICGLCQEPNNLTRIVAALNAPASTVALHLGVLRRAGILSEHKSGAEVRFEVDDPKTRRVLETLCHPRSRGPLARWNWRSLAGSLEATGKSGRAHRPRPTSKPRVRA